MTDKEAMKLALEALEWEDAQTAYHTIKALEEALAKQEQGEPVAWMYDWTSDEGEFIQDWTTSMAETLRDTGKTIITNVRPLYSAPQVIHKPLQHLGEIPMAWCRWSEHLGKWMYTHRQPTEELAWIPLYDHPLQKPMAIQMDVIVGNLVREGINKHRARELAEHFIKHTAPQPKQEQGEPVLEVINGQINRAWDAIPNGFTGLLYMQPQLTAPPKKPQEPWHGSARVDDYNRGWNECIDSINTTPQQRTTEPERQWVGLTDEEKQQCIYDKQGFVLDYEDVVDATEAKLKEKNT